MARGDLNTAAAVVLLLVGLAAVRADDLLPTHDDESMEETGRVGVISLSGSSNNYTLNLSGLIMLGLSVSASFMAWGYLHALAEQKSGVGPALESKYSSGGSTQKLSPSSTSLNYTFNLSGLVMLGLGVAAATMLWAQIEAQQANRLFKRAVDDTVSVASVLDAMEQRFESESVRELTCRQRIICEIASSGNEMTFPVDTFGHDVNAFFLSAYDSDQTMEELGSHETGKTYLAAWKHGLTQSCKSLHKCPLTTDFIRKLILRPQGAV